MSKMKPHLFRVLAVVIAMVVGLLLVEGIASAIFKRSLFRRSTGAGSQLGMLDEERRKAALLTEGPYAVPIDPLVGNEFKSDFNGTFVDAPWSSDSRRMRRRPHDDGMDSDGKRRILILGDSVAFGFGVEDDECLGAQLETIVRGAVRPGAPVPEVRTLAVPGWNFTNARRALLDRMNEFAPDLVIYVPVENDLDDAYSVTEAGFRNIALDIAVGTTHPHSALHAHHLWRRNIIFRRGHASAEKPDSTVWTLETGVTPESRRRYDIMTAGLVDLRKRLLESGGELVLVHFTVTPLSVRLLQYLPSIEGAPKSMLLFGTLTSDMTLPTDPHPNAATHRLAAIRLSKWLHDSELLDIDRAALPEEDESKESNQISTRQIDELVEQKRDFDERLLQQIGSVVDTRSGEGFHQVYGGIEVDGMIGQSTWMALRHPRANELMVEVSAVVDRKGQYPIDLALSLNGAEIGRVCVEGPDNEARRFVLNLPQRPEPAEPFDLSIEASNWSIGVVEGSSRLESVVISRIEVR